MKKGWKIALISLGSLIGTIAIVVAVACWLLFTPARLTSIVNKLADKYLLCENHFGKVRLSLFKTWPDAGLEVEDVVLINPYHLPEGNALAASAVQNDTLARMKSLTVGLDVKAFLKDGTIIVRQLRVDDTYANLYTDPDGWSNLDIFAPGEETPQEEESTGEPLQVQLEKVNVNNLSAQYCNLQQNMLASLGGLDLTLKGSMLDGTVNADLDAEAPSLMVDMRDSVGTPSLCVRVTDLALRAEGKGSTDTLQGCLKLVMPKGQVVMGSTAYTTDAMLASRRDLLTLDVPFAANLDKMRFSLSDASMQLVDYEMTVNGDVALANEGNPMAMDLRLAADRWQVGDLIAMLPPFITQSLKGMNVDGKASLAAHVYGQMAVGRMPLVDAEVELAKGSFAAPKMLPAPLRDIDAKLSASLNLSSDTAFSGVSKVKIDHLNAKMKHSSLNVSGTVDDLMGDMLVDANIKGKVEMPDLQGFLPDTMPLDMSGTAQINLTAKSRLSALTGMALEKVKAYGTMRFNELDVTWDSIHATSPHLDVALALPSKSRSSKVAELIDVQVKGGKLFVKMDNLNLDAHVENPNIHVGLPNILDDKQPLAAAFIIRASKINAEKDSMIVYSDTIKLKGSVRNDTTQDNVLKQWNPDVDIDLHRGVVAMAGMSEAVRMPSFKFNYKPEVCQIEQADILWGVSDYHLSGKVYGVEDWLGHTDMLRGTLDFSSQYADIDQLMGILSGMGTDEDTLARQRAEDNVPAEANPFIVPKDVNVRLNTHITRCVAFGNDLNTLGGSLTINNGVAVLDQIGFTCKAARMQLTGIYKSPRVNNLFVGLDFHLLDIQIEELLDMIPTIDTLVPMLKAFQGKANFHLAAECALDAFYKPKMSTILGAAAISGKDLVVLDNESLASMARLLQFKNWREKDNNIGVDSISVEAQVVRRNITVYPFLLNLHNYQLCIGGHHSLDNKCNYHLELLKCPLPARLAIDVTGNIAKPKIELGQVLYAEMYKPEEKDYLSAYTLRVKNQVRQYLEANVR